MELSPQFLESIRCIVPGNIVVYRMVENRLDTVYFSEGIPGLSGMTDDEYAAYVDKDAVKIVVDSDKALVAKTLAAIKQTGKTSDIVYRIFHKTKQYVWVHANARVIGELEGAPVLLCTFLDTSIETFVQADLLDHSNNMIYVVEDETWEILYANQPAVDQWHQDNHDHADYLGQCCYKFINHQKQPCPWCSLLKMTGDTFHDEVKYIPGPGVWMQADCARISWYGRPARVNYIKNVTEETELQRQLEKENSSWQRLISHIPSGLAIIQFVDGEFRCLGANEYCLKILGIDKSELVGKTFDETSKYFLPEDVERRRRDWEILMHTNSLDGVYRFYNHRLQRISWVELRTRMVDQPDGTKLAYVVYLDIDALKQAELEANHNRQLYESAAAAAQLVLWEYDIQSKQVLIAEDEVSKRFYAHFGIYETIENVPESLLTYIADTDVPAFLAMYRQVDAGHDASCDIWYKEKAGEKSQCSRVSYTVVKDAAGQPVKAYGIAQDITNQKMADERYRQELEYMNENDSVRLIAKGHHNLSQNRLVDHYMNNNRALEITPDYSYDDAAEVMVAMVIGEDKQRQFADMIKREPLIRHFHEGTTRFSLEYERKKNGHFAGWVRTDVNTFKAPHSTDIECFVYTYDLSEQVLERQVVEKLPVLGYYFLSIIDVEQGTYLYMRQDKNRAGAVFGGNISYNDSTLEEIRSVVFLEQQDRVIQASRLDVVQAALADNEIYTTVFSVRDPDGTAHQHCGQFMYVDDTHRTIFYCRSDVTEQYESEQQQLTLLQEAKEEADQANAAKSAFLSNISHDMRTPLNGIIGFSSLALTTEDAALRIDYLGKIKQSGNLLLDLINDTLDLSKIESGTLYLTPEVVEFADIIEDVVVPIRAMAADKHQYFRVLTDDLMFGKIKVDRLQLKKIFLNLLTNAVKYTPEGGTIDFMVKKEVHPDTPLNCRIIVHDTGIGISPGFLSRIYEPFAQENNFSAGKVSGTGLGLSIVKRIIDMMKGTIEVQSHVGAGSRFTVCLPIEEVHMPETTVDEAGPQASLAGLHVLMCEDNELNSEIAKTILEEQGVSVVCAANGLQGLGLFKASQPYEFQAILMDLRMPVMNGIDTARAIRALDRADAATIPIIATTADAYREDINRCREAGMNSHVAKPIVPDLLFAELRKFTRKPVV